MEYTTDDKNTEDTFHLLSTQLLKVSGEIVIIAFKKVDYGVVTSYLFTSIYFTGDL